MQQCGADQEQKHQKQVTSYAGEFLSGSEHLKAQLDFRCKIYLLVPLLVSLSSEESTVAVCEQLHTVCACAKHVHVGNL